MSNVLVVLVNFNSPKDTYRCLKSLAQCTLKPKVVVVDNCSIGEGLISEETAEICHADTHIIFNSHNDGFGGGNNIGIDWGLANSQAEYFFILNNDTVVFPDSIERLLKHLEVHSEMGMCSPAIFRLHEPDVYWFGGGFLDWKKAGARSPNINKQINHEVMVSHNTFITGCAMFIRCEVLIRVGGFSDDYFMYSEDIDYCQRVLDAGYTIGYAPSIKILHDAHASIMKNTGKYVSPEHWSNKNLEFVLQNVVYGTLLNLRKHSNGFERLVGTAWVVMRYAKWSFIYLFHMRIDGLRAIIKGVYFSVIGRRPV